MIPVPDIHQPTRPSPGLVAIMSARAREETLSSMMKHVREQAGIMNRIKWEERTEPGANANASTGAGGHPNKGTQRGGEGVRDSLTEGVEDVSRDFVRCTLSDVVNDIKSEDAEKRQLMDQRREGARARRLQREEQAHAARLEEENERARRRSYSVKSMDGLGGGAHVGGKRAGENERVGDEDRGPAPEASNAEAFVSQAALLLRATR
jgi:hypothetical protein